MPGGADIVNKVRTDLTLDASRLIRGERRVRRAMRRIDRIAMRTQAATSRVFRAALVPAAALGLGAGAVAAKIFQIGKAANDTERAYRTLLISAGKATGAAFADFDTATSAASALRMEIRELARESPATSREVGEAFQLIVFQATKAGLTLRQQAGLARDLAARAKIAGQRVDVVARDVQQLLQGRLVQIQTPELFSIREDVVKLVRSGKIADAAAMIQKTMGLTARETEDFGDSLTGQLATAIDQAEILAEEVAKPLLVFATEKLGEANKWLRKNRSEALKMARAIGNKAVRGVSTLLSFARKIVDNWEIIEMAAKTFAVVWIGSVAVRGLARMVSLGSQLYGILRGASRLTFGAAAGAGIGTKGVGKALGAVGLIATAAATGEDLGRAAAGLFVDTGARDRALGRAGAIVLPGEDAKKAIDAQRAAVRAARERRKAVAAQDPLALSGTPGAAGKRAKIGVGRASIRVDRAEMDPADFSRLMLPFVAQLRLTERLRRPSVVSEGVGLGAAALPVPNGG